MLNDARYDTVRETHIIPAYTSTVGGATYVSDFTFTPATPCCSSWVSPYPSSSHLTSVAAHSMLVLPPEVQSTYSTGHIQRLQATTQQYPPSSMTLALPCMSRSRVTKLHSNIASTSPSVYIAFQSVYARDKCGTVGETIIAATTLAFDITDISSDNFFKWDTARYTTREPAIAATYTQWDPM